MSNRTVLRTDKHRVAFSSVAAAVFLTLMKLIVGLMTGSLGILSEAAHSALDLIAAIVTFFAVKVSDKPADEVHQFGHGKVENLSALIETLLLLLTCGWIIYESISRLFFKVVEVDANVWAFGVMGISIVIDISRSRALARAAKEHNSQALEADALHFRTDIWSSSVVIVGLVLLRVGEALGIPELAKADAVAALVVAGIVIFISSQLGKRSVAVLLDAAPRGLREQISQAVLRVPGVSEVRQVRVRQAGPKIFVDLVLGLPVDVSLQAGHEIAGAAERAIAEVAPQADVFVHVENSEPPDDDLPARVRAIAAVHGLRVHGLHAHEVGGTVHLDLHVEVDNRLNLERAHELVSRFEADLMAQYDLPLEIVSHIEPVATRLETQTGDQASDSAIRALVMQVAGEVCGRESAHEVQLVTDTSGRRDLTLHCHIEGDMPVTLAHQIAERAEAEIRKRVPDLGRIVIHLEPFKPADRLNSE